MSMRIPNKDIDGETYIITHCEDLNKARRPGEMTRTTSFKSIPGAEEAQCIFVAVFLPMLECN